MQTALFLLLATLTPSGQTAAQNKYDAKLGTYYKLGPEVFVSGSKEKLEIGVQRLVALKSVNTCIAFATKTETIVAKEGKILVIFTATIKNPEKNPISIFSSQTFGLRLYESGFKSGDVNYIGGYDSTLSLANKSIKSGESIDVICVYEFPQTLKNLKIGIYYDRQGTANVPKYDLTQSIPEPTSVFGRSKLSYEGSATVKVGQEFDFDALMFKVIDCKPTSDKGYRVRVEIRNPMLKPVSWGWQYAKAEVSDESGNLTAYYPAFYPLTEGFSTEVNPGQTVVGDYQFYPTKGSSPKRFSLTMNSTKRSVSVTGL